jgi:SPP1 gp7 family putative phage head morphogenesis protein
MKLFDYLNIAKDFIKKFIDSVQEGRAFFKRTKEEISISLKDNNAVEKRRPQKRVLAVEEISKQTIAQRDSMKKNGFKEYEYIANSNCCPACAALNGKHFKVSKLKIGVNAPPMHDGCRCSIAAYEDQDEYEKWLNSL